MYNQVDRDVYSIKLCNDKYFLFHRFLGEPFIVETDDLLHNWLDIKRELGWFRWNYSFEDYINDFKNFVFSYSGPKVLDLSISESCNLNCHMCFYSVKSLRSSLRKKLMSFSLVKKWVDFYVDIWSKKLNLNYLSFHLGAAEPFLNKEVLMKTVEYINEKTRDRDKEILINTNLTLADKYLLDFIADNGIKISVGIDGLFEVNDIIRGKGTFKKVVDNIAYLVKKGVKPGVNLTLTSRNFDKVEPREFLDFMKSLGINAVLVDVDLIEAIPLQPEDIVDLLMMYQTYGDEIGMEIRGNWKAPFFNLISESSEPKTFCSSLRGKNLVVTSQGYLTFCTYASKIIAKSVDKYDIENSFQQFIRNIRCFMLSYFDRVKLQCRTCPIMAFCYGGCFLTIERKGKFDILCNIYKLATSKLVKYKFT